MKGTKVVALSLTLLFAGLVMGCDGNHPTAPPDPVEQEREPGRALADSDPPVSSQLGAEQD